MNSGEPKNKVDNTDDISVQDLIDKIKFVLVYVKSKWFLILSVSLLGALLGLVYSLYTKPAYTAVCTFVLEDAKSGGGLGQYAGLASLAGVNLGDAGGGIFRGDNILELYKSRTMIERAFLSEIDINGKREKLIERYIDFNHLRKKWNDNKGNVEFNGDPDKFDRKQDSIITDFVDLFNKKVLNVFKPDKKLNIIDVNVTSNDELFAKAFTNKLVETVNDFYILTKTKKEYQNVQILQHQADSVKLMLNSSIHGVASAIDADPNANPLMSTLRETSQKRQVDVQANEAIYSEIVKNLELAKISLRQEMPLIQVIDKPVLPLAVKKAGKLSSIVIWGLLSGVLAIVILLFRKAIVSSLSTRPL